MPIYSKSARCFPNECYICKSRGNLIRCECNMIFYCSEDHRQQHQSTHKDFCTAVKELLKRRKITHIYEQLSYISILEWDTTREEIRNEIIKKLGRTLSPLENFMFYSPRICYYFDCCETKQEDLINCPYCPVASFCKRHKNDKTHKEYCKTMSTYLKVLTTAEELNIDLDFLSSAFPFIGDKYQSENIDDLTVTYVTTKTNTFGVLSKLHKVFLINFIDFASKMNNALQKINDTIPEELTIHIDDLSYYYSVAKVNFWEFLLHLNPRIKKLKIVMTTIPDPSGLKTSLCKNCHSEGRNFILEASVKSYEDYMLDENYQEPDILIYVEINIQRLSQGLNKWSELNCPIILQFDSHSDFCKAQHFLSSSVCSTTGEINKKTNTPASSSSKRSFVAISEPADEEEGKKNKKSKTENCSKSIDAENFDPNVEEGKIAKKNDKVNSQSYLIEHISYLKNENEGLRQQLNSSVNEVTKLQTKLNQVTSDLEKILRGIVDSEEALQ